MSSATSRVFLPVVQPFDFRHSLRFLGLFSPTEGEQTIANQSLTKAIRIGEQTVVFAVAAEGEGLEEGLVATLTSRRPLDMTTQMMVKSRIRLFLSLDDDLRPFYAVAEQDPVFWPVAQRWYGYHQVRFLTPFENACWAILSTRNRIENTRAIKARLVDVCGDRLEVAGQSYPAFPTAAAIASLDPQQLEDLVGQSRRAAYLLAAAQAFANVEETWLHDAPYEQVQQWLLDIRGIGPWGAAFVLIRGLGRMERLAAPERKLVQAASRLYGQKLDEEAVIALANRFAPYQGYWAHYIRADAEPEPGRAEGMR